MPVLAGVQFIEGNKTLNFPRIEVKAELKLREATKQ